MHKYNNSNKYKSFIQITDYILNNLIIIKIFIKKNIKML